MPIILHAPWKYDFDKCGEGDLMDRAAMECATMVRSLDFEVLERAQRVHTLFKELRELGEEDTNQLFLRQTALVFRLQQDVYFKFDINFAEPVTRLDQLEMDTKASDEVESRRAFFYQGWVQAHKSDDTEATVILGLLTTACEFWITSRFAYVSELTPLKLCVLNNHLLIASVPKADVNARALRYTNMFLDTGEYDFVQAHWPYIDDNQLLRDYENLTGDNGPLAQQFMGFLRGD